MGAALGWGLGGGWWWSGIVKVTAHCARPGFPFVQMVILGLAGMILGLLVAWPRLGRLSLLAIGIITVSWILLLSALQRGSFDQYLSTVATVTLVAVLVLLPIVLFRVTVVRLASLRRGRSQYLIALAAFFLLTALALIPTWLMALATASAAAQYGCFSS